MKMSLWHTTIFRLLLTYALVSSLTISALVYLNYWQSTSYTATQADHNIDWQMAYFSSMTPSQLKQAIDNRVKLDTHPRVNFYGLFSRDHRWIAGEVRTFPDSVTPDGEGKWSPSNWARQTPAEPLAASNMRAKAITLRDGEVFVIERDVGEFDRLREYMLGCLVWSAAIALAGSIGVGALFSARQLRRLKDIRRISQRIARGEFGTRLPVGSADEITWLSRIVNHMLDEVSRLMLEIKDSCDGIAHDLRTPLIHMRSLLARIPIEAVDAPHRGLLQGASEHAEAVLRRFTAMLRISEIESGSRRSGFGDVEMHALAREIGELYEPVAAQKDIELRLDLDPVRSVRADRPLMFEALVNLIDNAIKFTPHGGKVVLSVVAGAHGPRILLKDGGPGIPESDREAVFRRFYRAEAARATPGSGLGLSIVHAVMHLHEYRLALHDGAPGLLVTIDCWPHTSVWE
jgi:signal transduction histidine kinase